jgi:hypothetical protein
MSTLYQHADFPGNPRKSGIVNVSLDVPSLPASARKLPARKQTTKTPSKALTTPKDINAFKDDAKLMSLVNPDHDLTSAERSTYERSITRYQQYLYPNNPEYGYHHNRVLSHRS